MQCPNCGTELPDDSTMCTECNYEIEEIQLGAKLNATSNNKNAVSKTNHIGVYTAILIPLLIIASLLTFLLGYADGNISEAIEIVKDCITPSDENSLIEKDFFNIQVTLPASISEDDAAGVSLINDIAKMNGVKKVTKDQDGSVTVTTQRKAYDSILLSIKSALNKRIMAVVNDTNSSFMIIDYNDDVTAFDISVDTEFLSASEAPVATAFFAYGNIYQIFNNVAKEDLQTVINLIDYGSKEALASFDSTTQKDVNFQGYINIPEQEQQIDQEPSESQSANNEFAASYMPAEGPYVNSTNGGFPHTCEIRVKKKDENSFAFSIWEIIDDNGNGCDNMIFAENTAVFDTADTPVAIFRGQTYTLYLDCSSNGVINLNGFSQATLLGNEFVNIDAIERNSGL